MPTTTWTRALPRPVVPYRHMQNKVVTRKGFVTLQDIASEQVTTSFRSSAREDRARGGSSRDMLDGRDLRKTLGQDRGVGNRQFDTGHDFYTKKTWTDFGLLQGNFNSGTANNNFYTHVGYIYPPSWVTAGKNYPSLDSYEPDQAAREADGRKYVAQTIPTAPEVSLATFLGEIRRDGLPHLVGALMRKKGVSVASFGGEYLNYTFGVAPTISDVQNMALSVLKANKMAKELQYRRNTDTVVRKRSTLSEKYTAVMRGENTFWVTPMMEGDLVSPQNTFFRYYTSEGTATVIDEIITRKWFTGAWSYHLAEAHSFLGKLESYEQKANHLLGIRFTPETLWELTPWSWLFDYFSDAGTFIKNVTYLSDDSLVLRYGYVMHETIVKRTTTMAKLTRNTGGNSPKACWRIDNFHSKRRTRSTPYGFGVNLGALSPRRWAVLAALGFTKTEKGLNYRDFA